MNIKESDTPKLKEIWYYRKEFYQGKTRQFKVCRIRIEFISEKGGTVYYGSYGSRPGEYIWKTAKELHRNFDELNEDVRQTNKFLSEQQTMCGD